MEPNALDFFETLLETPSPSGYESTVQQVVRDYVTRLRRRGPHRPARQRNRGQKSRRPVAGHAGRPLRPDRPDRPAHRRQRFSLHPAHRRLGPAGAHRPADDRLDRGRPGVRRDRPQADPPAHRRRAEAGAEDEGLVARHRRGQQGRGCQGGARSAIAVTLELGFRTMPNSLAVSPAMDDKAGCGW